MNIVEDLKARARILHRDLKRGDEEALARVRRLPELRDLGASLTTLVQRRHCLTVVAQELGFGSWPALVGMLRGASDDFGTLLHRHACFAHWNIWSASYEEARAIRAEHGGYLLGYRRQYLVVDEHYIRTLGLDPADPDWEAIGRDWVRPASVEARSRLMAELIRQRATS